MDDDELIDRARSALEAHLEQEEPVPFVKTCSVCKEPIRADDPLSVAMQATMTPREFEHIQYYCHNHGPSPSEITDRLLVSHGVVLTVRINEPSPDCNPADRTVIIEDAACDSPASL